MYQNLRLSGLAFLFALALFTSCRKETVDPKTIDFGTQYYPLTLGKYIIYKTDSTIYDDFNKVDYNRTNYLMYTVEDTFRDNQGRLSFYTTIRKRKNTSDPWQSQEVIYVTPTAYGLDVVQNNLRFTKLAFPVQNDFSWKGNSQIPSGDQDYQYFQNWDYKYLNKGNDVTIGSSVYGNTVTVLERDEQINDPETQPKAYAEKTYSKAVYAENIGLIQKELTRWVYQVNPAAPQDAYRKGYKVVMNIVSHN